MLFSPDIRTATCLRKIKLAERVSYVGEMRNAYKDLVGNRE